eukprot:GHVP01036723.1.p1 GENE.GHVP01036723.1~~GHVP01036723.1.p1  ORF type:complete len:187 (-),score=26.28 GHVP01036723.1:600-1160(-)
MTKSIIVWRDSEWIVSKFSGNMFKTIGYTQSSVRILYPEEVLFLLFIDEYNERFSIIKEEKETTYEEYLIVLISQKIFSYEEINTYLDLKVASYPVFRIRHPVNFLSEISIDQKAVFVVYEKNKRFSLKKPGDPIYQVLVTSLSSDFPRLEFNENKKIVRTLLGISEAGEIFFIEIGRCGMTIEAS